MARSVLLPLVVAVGLGALDILAAGNVLPDVARYPDSGGDGIDVVQARRCQAG
jgi:hypothetical protein